MPPRNDSELHSDSSDSTSEANVLRFRGLTSAGRAYLSALDQDPCPSMWPGGDRVAYAAHVLSPLKALVGDLDTLLGADCPTLALEARVGRSLASSGSTSLPLEDCPVRGVRAWHHHHAPDSSPILFAQFTTGGIEVGVAAAGGDPASTARVRESLRDGDSELSARAQELASRGWMIAGQPAAAGTDPLPEGYEAWNRGCALRVFRALDWDRWTDEPGLAHELADRWREVLPFFDRMGVRDREAVASAEPTDEIAR